MAESIAFAKESRLTDETQTLTIQATVPARLMAQVQALVDTGWFTSREEVVVDALRRFVESHRMDLMEKFVREDIEWGLHGED